MKLFLFTLAVVTLLPANNETTKCEKTTTIAKSQLFSSSISPDKLSTRLLMSITEKQYAQTSNKLASISKILKKYDNICKDSGYSIVKATRWDSEKKKNLFIGYRGTISFKCEYNAPSEIEKLYNEPIFKKLVRRHNNVTLNNQGTRWIVSKDALNQKKKN